MNAHPPRWAAWLLRHLRLRGDEDILLGDFEEEFHYLRHQHGLSYARRWYVRQVLVSLPGFTDQLIRWSSSMLKNYLLVAARAFRKHPLYASINVLGLALALACSLTILLFVADERSFDTFHVNGDQLYRLERIAMNDGRSSFTDGPTGPAMAAAFPEIQSATRLSKSAHLLRRGDYQAYGDEIAYADSTFLQMFSFDVLQGDRATILSAPNSIVLTAAMASKYFGDQNPVGQTMVMDNATELVVTGVLADIPSNSHYTFDALAPFSMLVQSNTWLERFGSIGTQTYVLLMPQAHPSDLATAFADFAENNPVWTKEFYLRPITDIHLYSNVYELESQGDINTVYLFSAIALFILLLACINYVNLSTARSAQRMKEVGMRKVLGADRVQLLFQFLGESILMTALALGLALVLVLVFLPGINGLMGRELSLAPLVEGRGLFLLMGGILIIGTAAGLYPALHLARFRPAQVLKRTIHRPGRTSRFRQALVVTQFAVSITLIVATLVIGQQLQYMQQQDLGFDQEQIVTLPLRDGSLVTESSETLKERLLSDPQVMHATVTNSGVDAPISSGPVAASQFGERDASSPVHGYVFADPEFQPTLGLDVIAGESLWPEREGRPNTDVLITRQAVTTLGWSAPEEAIGQTISATISDGLLTVVGVVDDFHTASLHRSVRPMIVFGNAIPRNGKLMLRLAPGSPQAALSRFETIWNEVLPEWPFEYEFLDDHLQQRYEQDQQEAALYRSFAALALFIACLGLFGLAAFMAQQRTKEIGVRKVLGASVRQIVLLLSREFSLLVGVAVLVAIPVAYTLMDRWLEDFAYRIEVPWTAFAMAALLAFGIAALTVSYHAVHAARRNPVRSLRSE
ncbi:MAG: ABC transporter permease [Rhodothermales bacterium]